MNPLTRVRSQVRTLVRAISFAFCMHFVKYTRANMSRGVEDTFKQFHSIAAALVSWMRGGVEGRKRAICLHGEMIATGATEMDKEPDTLVNAFLTANVELPCLVN